MATPGSGDVGRDSSRETDILMRSPTSAQLTKSISIFLQYSVKCVLKLHNTVAMASADDISLPDRRTAIAGAQSDDSAALDASSLEQSQAHRGESTRKRATVLFGCALSQLPIWGKQDFIWGLLSTRSQASLHLSVVETQASP